MSSNNPDMKTILENTLHLNHQMQSQLLTMREQLEKILSNVKDTYKANDVLLKEGILKRRKKGFGIKGAYLRGGTFYLKGNMFFKDIKCRNCPNNEDYEKRKRENEMFPMDLNLKSRHVWSTQDKQGIIVGIKEQITDYLKQSSKRFSKKNNEVDSKKLSKLLNMVPDDFRIDWNYISSSNLHHRHSAKTCEAIWNLFLHPSLKRAAWSEEENNKLLEAAKKYNFQNWLAIAEEVGERSEFQCFVQYKNYVCHMLPESYTKWSKEDDKRLLDAISRNSVNGIINWSNVNAYFPHKAKTTLHTRYNCTLNPAINHGAQFTPEEDLLLIAAVKEYGKKFNCIPRSLFPNRSLVQLRCHYNNVLSKRHNQHPWSLDDDIKLMHFVTENGKKAWLECEHFLDGKHSRTSCRTRFYTIKNYLEKHPNASIDSLPRKQTKPCNGVNINNWKEKIDELSSNPNEVKQTLKDKKRRKVKTVKNKRVKNKKIKTEKISFKRTAKRSVDKILESKDIEQPPFHNAQHAEEIQPVKTETQTNKTKINKKIKKGYNFKMNQHPCDNTTIKHEDFTMVMSALNPQIPFVLEDYEFDSSLPENIKSNIINYSSQLPTSGETLNFLPPSWSTAMGFRALCIHTASDSSNYSAEKSVKNINNDHSLRFRERFRSVFYSTALLSRLDPSMVDIPNIETEPKTLNRKRSTSFKDKEKNANIKKKCIDVIENIKTEFEA